MSGHLPPDSTRPFADNAADDFVGGDEPGEAVSFGVGDDETIKGSRVQPSSNATLAIVGKVNRRGEDDSCSSFRSRSRRQLVFFSSWRYSSSRRSMGEKEGRRFQQFCALSERLTLLVVSQTTTCVSR